MKAIRTKYFPATNLKPAYYKANDQDGNTAKISASTVNNADEGHRKAAEALKHKMKWSGRMVQGGLSKSEEVFVFVDGLDALIEHVDNALSYKVTDDIEDGWHYQRQRNYQLVEQSLKIVKKETGEKI